MGGWLKGALFAALSFTACWGSAIWYWRATERMPTTGDLVLYLLALPLALLVAVWGIRKLIALPALARGSAAPAQQKTAAAAHMPAQSLAILAAALRVPHGASAEELYAAIVDNKARPDLDPELLDEDGFPVMTARRGDASDEALQEEITGWLAGNGMADLHFSEAQWRALTMASAVASDLASHAASVLVPADGVAPMLQLAPILPAEWHLEQRRAAGMWLKHTVAQLGWPAARIALADEVPDEAHDATPSAVLRRLRQDDGAIDAPLVAMVVACASHISDETVAEWSASASLFTAAQPQGLIPGEGAAGLLLTGLRQARLIEGAAFALLDPTGEGRRDSSSDASRRAEPKLLCELAERSLERGGVKACGVAMVVADTGHRSNRMLELMGFAAAAMPHLDGADDVLHIGAASGTCGAVPFITALALARHLALERDAAVLCVSNEDPYRRCAALVRPAAGQELTLLPHFSESTRP